MARVAAHQANRPVIVGRVDVTDVGNANSRRLQEWLEHRNGDQPSDPFINGEPICPSAPHKGYPLATRTSQRSPPHDIQRACNLCSGQEWAWGTANRPFSLEKNVKLPGLGASPAKTPDITPHASRPYGKPTPDAGEPSNTPSDSGNGGSRATGNFSNVSQGTGALASGGSAIYRADQSTQNSQYATQSTTGAVNYGGRGRTETGCSVAAYSKAYLYPIEVLCTVRAVR